MTHYKKTAFIILLSFILAACATTSGTKVSDEDLGKIKKGKTTYSEVIETLGKPSTKKTTKDGVILVYSYSEARSDALSYVPIASMFGKTKSKYRVVNIFFDNNHVVRDVQIEDGESEGGTSL